MLAAVKISGFSISRIVADPSFEDRFLNYFTVQFVMARSVLNLAHLVQMKRRTFNVKFFINEFYTLGMGWLSV